MNLKESEGMDTYGYGRVWSKEREGGNDNIIISETKKEGKVQLQIVKYLE